LWTRPSINGRDVWQQLIRARGGHSEYLLDYRRSTTLAYSCDIHHRLYQILQIVYSFRLIS